MTAIWERTHTALLGLHVPIAANVLMLASGVSWPDVYIAYQLITSSGEQHANNLETCRSLTMQVTVYSRNGLINLPDVTNAMLQAGFTKGAERELPYSSETKHYGLAMDFYFLETAP
ncbi:MAG: hypothetical protein ABFD14_01420 [Anaerolineaceae bacterium]